MRGSRHARNIHESFIDVKGMHIGKPYRTVTGILSDAPVQAAPGSVVRASDR